VSCYNEKKNVQRKLVDERLDRTDCLDVSDDTTNTKVYYDYFYTYTIDKIGW